MKKIAVIFMSLLLVFALFGCGNNGSDTTNDGATDNNASQTDQNNSGDGIVNDVEKATDDVVDGVENGVDDLTDNNNNKADTNGSSNGNGNAQAQVHSSNALRQAKKSKTPEFLLKIREFLLCLLIF